MSETAYMKRVIARAAELGVWLYRNNVGMCLDSNGRVVKFGLAKGSSDLIGWTPYTVTAEDVGRRVAIFTAIECKATHGRVRPEQERWIEAVLRDGGIARVMREPEDYDATF